MSRKYFLSTFSVYNSQNMHIFAFCETHQKNTQKLTFEDVRLKFRRQIWLSGKQFTAFKSAENAENEHIIADF